MKRLLGVVVALFSGCGGDAPPAGSPDDVAAEENAPPADEPANELARALILLQAPNSGAGERREAMRAFVEVLLMSDVYVPASGPTIDRSTIECFTDAASVAVRYPGQTARAVDARSLLAHARDQRVGIVIRHEGRSGSVYTGFTPADAARLLEI